MLANHIRGTRLSSPFRDLRNGEEPEMGTHPSHNPLVYKEPHRSITKLRGEPSPCSLKQKQRVRGLPALLSIWEVSTGQNYR